LKTLLIGAALAALALAQSAAAPVEKPSAADWREVDAAHTVVIDTNKGRIVMELYPNIAPISVARIEDLTRKHTYDGLTFFRVIDDFMDQTGDPMNTGEGGSDQPDIKAEFNFKTPAGFPVVAHPENGGDAGFIGVMPVVSQPAALAALTADGKVDASVLYCKGVIGIARADSPDSGNSQFFLMRGMKLELDQKYTAIGRVVVGQDVVDTIKTGEPVEAPRDRMVKVQILADMAPADRPTIKVIDTKSAWFTAYVKREKAAKGTDFTPCDLTIASTAK
jgi:peptidylprolyl isomerase